MLNNEEINLLSVINLEDKNFTISFICFHNMYKQKDKEISTEKELREIMIYNSIFEKNIEKTKEEKEKQQLKMVYTTKLNINKLKELKNKFNIKIEKEEIEIYLKDINEDIEKIREFQKLKIQEQQELKKQKELNKKIEQKDKNIKEDFKDKYGNDILSL